MNILGKSRDKPTADEIKDLCGTFIDNEGAKDKLMQDIIDHAINGKAPQIRLLLAEYRPGAPKLHKTPVKIGRFLF